MSRAVQDRLARLIAKLTGSPEPPSGYPRPTQIRIAEGDVLVRDDEVTIDVSVSPAAAEAIMRALAEARAAAVGADTEPEGQQLAGPLAFVRRVEEAGEGRGEDRSAVVRMPDRTVFVLADGAGGVIAGAAAAEHVCAAVVKVCGLGMPTSWSDWLVEVDRAMPHAGLAAAVVVEVGHDGRIVGASAGDCEAWLLSKDGSSADLTERQFRKPLMGEGRVMAMGFEADAKPGDLLIVATDGLWRHSSRMRIRELVARRTPIVEVADELVELARRTTGKLQDDVAIVICEIRIGAAISVGPGR